MKKIFQIVMVSCFGLINASKPVLLWNSANKETGLYANLAVAAEWIYCVKKEPNLSLCLNMSGGYGHPAPFLQLFKKFNDAQIFLEPPEKSKIIHVGWSPHAASVVKNRPTNGMGYFENRCVLSNVKLYTDPNFDLYRRRMYPVVRDFFKPVANLQRRIDHFMGKVRAPKVEDTKVHAVGIHVRCCHHYWTGTLNNNPDQNYLIAIEKDIDQLMASKDPQNTRIFLATLMEPLIERLSAKYDVVVVPNVPRTADVYTDWMFIKNDDPLDMARDAIVDVWCLSQCDEVWGGSSNVLVFAGLINPELEIHLLPSLLNYDGA